MKQFIVLAAILPILLVFAAQFSLDETNHIRTLRAESAVQDFRQRASLYGAYGEAETAALRAKLARIAGRDPGEVYIEMAAGEKDAKGSRIVQYRITVPIGKIMAGGAFMGVSESENQGALTFSGEFADQSAEGEAEAGA
ncbi:MAG: hypothetical protein LBS85_08205 [Clostridiales Family XIII bacterium]|jgi:hypothetical protein|nr:hypothetical protein [Clostridiales Family XIII bacterium]